MHSSKWSEENDPVRLSGLIRQWPLGAWVVPVDGELVVNHIPFLLDESAGSPGVLTGHVARANPVWKGLVKGPSSLVIFQGEQAYISPSWYPSKAQDGRSVPTWNYCVVHARGVAQVIEDPLWLTRHLTELTATHEAGQARPWSLEDAPAGHIDRLVGVIVGIRIPLDSLTGTWKLGQNRSPADRAGAIAGLLATGDGRARALAGKMAAITAEDSPAQGDLPADR